MKSGVFWIISCLWNLRNYFHGVRKLSLMQPETVSWTQLSSRQLVGVSEPALLIRELVLPLKQGIVPLFEEAVKIINGLPEGILITQQENARIIHFIEVNLEICQVIDKFVTELGNAVYKKKASLLSAEIYQTI